MTTNQTIEEINIELEKAQNKDINIKIASTIGTLVHFLDVTITNENGQLRTSIFHKPTAEPYILPYTSDHPHHIHRNIPYAALLRAARLCSHINDFNTERIRIDISLLLNVYPPYFITKQFNRFFHLNNALPVLNQLNQEVYHRLHQTLLHQPTRREKQLYTSDGIGSVSNRIEPNRTESKSVRFEVFKKSVGSVRFGPKLFRFGSVRFEENK
jgi:hypothetical protein